MIAQVLHTGGIRRTAEIFREVAYSTDIVQRGLLAIFAHPQVVDHALAQRTDARPPSFHDLLLS